MGVGWGVVHGCHCDACGLETLCGGCSADCARAGCRGPCHRCGIRCRGRDDAAAWVADAGGNLALGGAPWPVRLPDNLPVFVPEVDGFKLADFDCGLEWPAYAVGLKRVVGAKGALRPRWRGRGADEVLGLPPGRRLLMLGFGRDELIERIWTFQHRRRFYDAVASLGFDLVAGMNYSVYGDQPRFEHLLNLKRSALAAERLAAAGVPAVPSVYWWRQADLDRWLEWIQATRIPMVAVNAQTFRTPADRDILFHGLAYLGCRLPGGVTVLVSGLSRPDRVRIVRRMLPRVIFASQHPWQMAWHGRVLGDSRPTGRGAVQLFRENVLRYAEWTS